MKLSEIYWIGYIDKIKNNIIEILNDPYMDMNLQIELLDIYKIINSNDVLLEEKKRKAILVEHYLNMVEDIHSYKIRNR